jgi:hypothetical protein
MIRTFAFNSKPSGPLAANGFSRKRRPTAAGTGPNCTDFLANWTRKVFSSYGRSIG